MSREYAIHEAKNLIWRNLPSAPSTFSACARGCGQNGRGGGICLNCAEASLAKLTNILIASQYVATLLNVRRIERELEAFINLPPSEKPITIPDCSPNRERAELQII